MDSLLELLASAGTPGVVAIVLGAAAFTSAAHRAWGRAPLSVEVALAPLLMLLSLSGWACRAELEGLAGVLNLPADERAFAISRIIGARSALPILAALAAAPALVLGLLAPQSRDPGARDWPAAAALGIAALLATALPFLDMAVAHEVGPGMLVYLPIGFLGLRAADVTARKGGDREAQIKTAAEWLVLITLTTTVVLVMAQIMGIHGSSPASRPQRLEHKAVVLNWLLAVQAAQGLLAALPLLWATRDKRRATAAAAIIVAVWSMWWTNPRPHLIWILEADY